MIFKDFIKRIKFIISIFILKKKYQNSYRWFCDKGDEKLMYDFNLNENSLVFDVGGYKGNWSKKIHEKFNAKIIIFEPVSEFYNYINNRFNNKQVQVYRYALSNRNATSKIYLNEDGSSLMYQKKKFQIVNEIDINEFIKEKKIKNIDLIKINIEGGEYALLNRMIECNILDKIKTILVQFHKKTEEDVYERKKIIKNILKTHNIKWSYEFVWECFENKN